MNDRETLLKLCQLIQEINAAGGHMVCEIKGVDKAVRHRWQQTKELAFSVLGEEFKRLQHVAYKRGSKLTPEG